MNLDFDSDYDGQLSSAFSSSQLDYALFPMKRLNTGIGTGTCHLAAHCASIADFAAVCCMQPALVHVHPDWR